MVDVAYPLALPGPQAAPFTPADRLRRSDLPGRQHFAARELDFRGSQEVSFLYSPAQAALFDGWWRTTLHRGGLLFAAGWPLPASFTGLAIRKFRGTPRWVHVGNGWWRVSVNTEVYGRGVLPQEPAGPGPGNPCQGGLNDEFWLYLPPSFSPPSESGPSAVVPWADGTGGASTTEYEHLYVQRRLVLRSADNATVLSSEIDPDGSTPPTEWVDTGTSTGAPVISDYDLSLGIWRITPPFTQDFADFDSGVYTVGTTRVLVLTFSDVFLFYPPFTWAYELVGCA